MLSAVQTGYKDILKDITVDFKAGGWTHVIGPNGAGKSTLIKALCGLIPLCSGQIRLHGQDLATLSLRERAKWIAYVPQRLENLPQMTVFDFVMQSHFAISDDHAAFIHTKRALEQVNLCHLSGRHLHTLSGGELQRAMIAAALAQNTPILLFDEPTSSLDIAQSEAIYKLLYQIRSTGKTIITVTHDLRLASCTADTTLVLKNGKCVWHAPGFPQDAILNAVFETTSICIAPLQPQLSLNTSSPLELTNGSEPSDTEQSLSYPSIRPPILYYSFLLLFLCLLLMPWLGATILDPGNLTAIDKNILVQLRIPRVVWGAVSGATLACVGAALQAMLQNPLATPYTLGMASGSSLGAMITIALGITSLWILPATSFLGGISVMALVLTFGTRSATRSPTFFIITGVAASMLCSAVAMVFQALSAPLTAQQMMRWQMGGLDIVGYTAFPLLPIICLCLAWLYHYARPLDLISVDTSLAQTRGVHVQHVRRMTFILTSIATALVISICGPISFVGLLVPLALRRRFGANLRQLLPLCAIMGALFILIADMLARCLEPYAAIPVGVVVAIIGVPAVIFFLLPHHDAP